MDVIVECCAGLDVHRDSVVATVRLPGTGKSRRRREHKKVSESVRSWRRLSNTQRQLPRVARARNR